MALVALRQMNVNGNQYGPGEEVPPAVLTPSKAAQLVAQRQLIDTTISLEGSYRSLRSFTLRDLKVKRGDIVPSRLLDPFKLGQLLEHRFLEPTATE
ncbi:MAG: hypothetical protein ABFD60_01665 [Bryobacteraceae bacterium]